MCSCLECANPAGSHAGSDTCVTEQRRGGFLQAPDPELGSSWLGLGTSVFDAMDVGVLAPANVPKEPPVPPVLTATTTIAAIEIAAAPARQGQEGSAEALSFADFLEGMDTADLQAGVSDQPVGKRKRHQDLPTSSRQPGSSQCPSPTPQGAPAALPDASFASPTLWSGPTTALVLDPEWMRNYAAQLGLEEHVQVAAENAARFLR